MNTDPSDTSVYWLPGGMTRRRRGNVAVKTTLEMTKLLLERLTDLADGRLYQLNLDGTIKMGGGI